MVGSLGFIGNHCVFNVSKGIECWCSNTIVTSSSTGQLQAAGDCSMLCSGDPQQTCGGYKKIAIYSYKVGSTSTSSSPTTYVATTTTTSPQSSSAPSPSASWTRLGCFTDSKTRALSRYSETSISNNTPVTCSALCDRKGYTLSGVQYANQCYCSNTVDWGVGYGQPAPDGDCNMPCAGAAALTCGGSYRIEVYASSSYISTASQWKLKQNSVSSRHIAMN